MAKKDSGPLDEPVDLAAEAALRASRPGRKAGVAPKTTQIHNLPDGPADNEGLTPRQRKVLEFIKESVERRGFPPTIREIGDAVGLASTSSVSYQLITLQKKGFLRRDATKPRAVDVRLPSEMPERGASRGRPGAQQLPDAGATCPSSAASPPVGRSWPSRPWRRSSRSPASSSARARCSCSRSSASR